MIFSDADDSKLNWITTKNDTKNLNNHARGASYVNHPARNWNVSILQLVRSTQR